MAWGTRKHKAFELLQQDTARKQFMSNGPPLSRALDKAHLRPKLIEAERAAPKIAQDAITMVLPRFMPSRKTSPERFHRKAHGIAPGASRRRC